MIFTEICKNCKHENSTSIYLSADVYENPELKNKIINGSFFPNRCEKCEKPITLDEIISTSYWEENWVAFVLPINQTVSASWAINQVLNLYTNTKPEREIKVDSISVLGHVKDLIFILKGLNKGFYRKDLIELQLPYWDSERMALIKIVNCFIENNDPLWAFVVLAGLINDVPDFYFFSKIRDALELTAIVSKDMSMEQFGIKSTPNIQHNKIKSALEKHIPQYEEIGNVKLFYDVPSDGQPLNNGGNIMSNYPTIKNRVTTWLRLIIASNILEKRKLNHGAFIFPMINGVKSNWNHLTEPEKNELNHLYKMAFN